MGSLARKGGADERDAFKVVADMVEKAVSEDETTSSIWAKEDSHFKKLSDQQIGAMGQFWVRPKKLRQQNKEAENGVEISNGDCTVFILLSISPKLRCALKMVQHPF